MKMIKYKVMALRISSRNEIDRLLKDVFDNANNTTQEIMINLSLGHSIDFRLFSEEDIRNALSTKLVYQVANGDLKIPSVVREQIVRGYSDGCLSKAISEKSKNIDYLSHNEKVFELLAGFIVEGTPIPVEYYDRLYTAGLVNVSRNGSIEISQAVIDVVKELMLEKIYDEDVRLKNGGQMDTEFLRTPHYGFWHTEGGLAANLSSHVYMMFSSVGKVKRGEYSLPDFLQKVFENVSQDKWEAYVLVHDYGKERALKTKENGIDHSFHWHEEYSFDFVVANNPTYKGIEFDDMTKTVIKFHGFPLYLESNYSTMLSEGYTEEEILNILSLDFRNMLLEAKNVWQSLSNRDDFDEQEFVDMLIVAICLDCLGQVPLGKQVGDLLPAKIVNDIYNIHMKNQKKGQD